MNAPPPPATWRRVLAASAASCLLAAGGCASRAVVLPSGDGEPFPGYEAALAQATSGCRAVRSLTGELRVSGRVGGEKLRGRIVAGFESPGRLRLEGVAPFGPPAFILVASEAGATLLLPRDRAVLTGEPPAAILEALVGLELTPDALKAIVAGCGVPSLDAVGGRSFPDRWARVDLSHGAAVYLRRSGDSWQVAAAVAPPLRVEYSNWTGRTPAMIRLALEGGSPPADLRLEVSQAEVNVALGPEAFTVKVPPDATRITVDELRQSGPLGRR